MQLPERITDMLWRPHTSSTNSERDIIHRLVQTRHLHHHKDARALSVVTDMYTLDTYGLGSDTPPWSRNKSPCVGMKVIGHTGVFGNRPRGYAVEQHNNKDHIMDLARIGYQYIVMDGHHTMPSNSHKTP